MKLSIITIAWLALFGSALSVFSQSTYSRVDSVIVYKYPAVNDSIPYSKTVSLKKDTVGEIIEITSFKWDGNLQAWKGDRKWYTYNDQWANTAIYLQWKWDQGPGGWFQTSRYLALTDTSGNVTDKYNYYRNMGEESWIGYSRTSSLYDSSGNKVTETDYMWNSAEGSWENDFREEFGYDSSGRITARTKFEWSDYSSTWIEVHKYKYHYALDQHDRLSEYTELYWDKGLEAWDSIQMIRYAYLEDSALEVETIFGWSMENGWNFRSRTEYTYDRQGHLLVVLTSDWLNETWIGRRKEEYTYDNQGHQTQKATYDNHYGDRVDWTGDDRFDEVFDSAGRNTLRAVFDWNHETKSWEGLYRYQYWYETSHRAFFYTTELWDQDSLNWIAFKSYSNSYPDSLFQRINSEYLVGSNGQDSTLQDREFHFAQGQYFQLTKDLCEGETYAWRGGLFDSTGIYQEDYLSPLGSDSSFVLALQIHPNPLPFEISGDTAYSLGGKGTFSVPELKEASYRWMVENGTVLNGDMTDTIEIKWDVSGEGRVSVCVISQFGCMSDTAHLEIHVGISTVQNRWQKNVKIFPVPVKDILRIQTDFETGQLEVLDLGGRIVLISTDQVMNLSGLKSGVYLLHINDVRGQLRTTRKIVKE